LGLLVSGLLFVVGPLASCSSQLMQREPASPLEIRYRSWKRHTSGQSTAVSTSVYRDLLAKSMFSQCKMVPHDSEYYNVLVRRCGGLRAVFRGAARLFLERAASTDFLTPVRIDGRLKWVDLLEDSPCD
jgi:putative component of membrane protein insertase Oxa1/YidC/SpoIIIJ protein YidD